MKVKQAIGLLIIAFCISICTDYLSEEQQEINLCRDGQVATISSVGVGPDGSTTFHVNFVQRFEDKELVPGVIYVHRQSVAGDIQINKLVINRNITIITEEQGYTYLKLDGIPNRLYLHDSQGIHHTRILVCVRMTGEGKREVLFDPSIGRRK